MSRSILRRRAPRSLAVGAAALIAVATLPLVTAPPASAVTIGGFEIEGDTDNDGDEDWNDLTLAEVGTGLDNESESGQDASTFKSSSHEFSGGGTWDDWEFEGGNAAGKSDFGRFATYAKTVEVSGDDHQFLYFAFDRGSATGTSLYAFEFNQVPQAPGLDPNPVRSQGDIRIVVHDQGGGLISLTEDDAGVYVWDDPDQPAGGVGVDTDQDGDWDEVTSSAWTAASNSATISELPSWWTSHNVVGGTLGADRFVEVGIDLTEFGASVGCPSEGFNAANSRSITGTGAGALVDYVPWVPIDVPSTCSALEIEKHMLNADGSRGALLGGATFTITPDPTPDGDPDPNTGSLDVTDDGPDDQDPDEGEVRISPVEPGEYTIVEKTAPPGYVKDESSHEVTAPSSSTAETVVFDNGLGRVTWEKTDGETDEPLAGATFTLTATGGDAEDAPWNLDTNPIVVTDDAGRDVDEDDGEFRVVGLPTGQYELVETAAPAGYELDPTVATFTIAGLDAVTPAYGVFVDERVKSRLRVEKQDAETGAVLEGAIFALYVDDNGDPGLQRAGGDPDSIVDTCVTGANGRCAVPDASDPPSLDWGFTYYWVETVPPPGYNLPDDVVSDGITITAANAGTAFDIAEFEDSVSEIETDATSGTALPNASLSDTATLSGVPSNAGGTITFRAYGPVLGDDPAPDCTTPAFTSASIAVDGPGEYASGTFTPDEAGTYFWIASYSGDPANQVQPVTGECGDADETSVVAPAQPGIVTQATESASLPGGTIQDTATVSPVTPDAEGTITFSVYGPADADCSGPAAAVYPDLPGVVAPDGFGGFFLTATSPAFAPTQAGTYRWIASYSGDANNEAATGACNDANETSVVEPAQPAISTSATAATMLPAGMLSDTATVSGLTADATGDVTFELYGPADADCSDDAVFASTVALGTVTAGTASPVSGSYLPTAAGTYLWVASYEGDANNAPAGGECGDEGETSVVSPAQPAISTSATASAALPAGTLSDTAAVSGLNFDATGDVTFALYGPDDADCSGVAVFTSTVPLGTVTAGTASPTSGSFLPTAAGTYLWVASYEGDVNNAPVSGECGDEGETSVVSPAQPAISTSATASATLPAGTLSDTATVTGLTSDATGTVTFDLYGPDDADCSDDTVFTSTVALGTVAAGSAGPSSGSYLPAATGTYLWIASYSGDGNNLPTGGACGDLGETSVVSPAQPAISTSATAAATLPAGTLSDTATVTGLTADATGTVTFDLYGPDDADCSGDVVLSSTVDLGPVAAGTASPVSGSYLPAEAGTYLWIASYSGDGNNAPVSGECGDQGETSEVSPAEPTISTSATPSVTLPDGTMSDTATVSGLTASATGTVTFDLYGPGDATCSDDEVFTSTVALGTVTAGTASPVSGSFQPTQAGTYLWIASYSGDANNAPVSGECGDEGETSVTDPAQPAISTSATATATLPAGTLSDTATVTGLTSDASGTVTFELFGAGDIDCSGDVVLTSTVPLGTVTAGTASPVSGSYVPTGAGTYLWVATYSGDVNNEPVSGECGDDGETSVVEPAQPAISTSATPSATLPEGTISDTATVTGLTSDATGTVTFDLYGPDDADCSGDSVLTSAVPLGTVTAGTASPAGGSYLPTAAGIYLWVASYSGDGNNLPTGGECGDEGETSVVGPAVTSISTSATPTATLPAGTVSDTATVTGLTSDATGTVTFELFGPDDADCSGDSVFVSTVPLGTLTAGSASPGSGSFLPTDAGTYLWVASYSGDVNNEPSAGECGDEGETSVVSPAVTSISTSATESVTLPAGVIGDTATVSGLTSDAAGSVTFELFGPDDADCSGEAVFTSMVPLGTVSGGSASPASSTYLPTDAGTYLWVASYSGDANNAPSSGECGDEGETSVVDRAQPTISTSATSSATLPQGSISDVATVSGLTSDATGDVTFQVFGPDDPDCAAAAIFTSTVPLGTVTAGSAAPVSGSYVPTAAGTYLWVAGYAGDVNNAPVSGECGDEGETSVVNPAVTSIVTLADAGAVIGEGGTIADTATVSGATQDATGTVTFELYGPDDADCSGESVFTSTVDVTHEGATLVANSTAFTPTEPGTYRWIASYSGDANNAASTGLCNDEGETSVVRQGPVPELEKAADPASGTAVPPGQVIAYSVTVRNVGDVPVVDGVVTDVLPDFVTVDETSISDGGVLGDGTIVWTVDLGVEGVEGDPAERVLTYSVTVDADVPAGTELVNTATFFDLEATTTHPVVIVVETDEPAGAQAPAVVPDVVPDVVPVDASSPGSLAVTGLTLALENWLVTAAALLLVGSLLVLAVRRRRVGAHART